MKKMIFSKNGIIKSLMIGSLVLLLVLEILYLKWAYEYQKQQLQTQVEAIFKGLMIQTHEQFLQKTSKFNKTIKGNDETVIFFRSVPDNHVFTEQNLDSIPSSEKDTLEQKYQELLIKNQLFLSFQWYKSKTIPKISSTELQTAPYKLPIDFHNYWVVFPNYQTWVFRRILPEILYAVVLWFLVGFVFVYTWRVWQEQKRLALLKNEFMSNMAHELKTPIATVSVALEALQKFQALQNPKLTEEYLNISQEQIQRLSGLVENMMQILAFEQKGIALNFENLDLKAIIEGVIYSFQPLFREANAQVDFKYEGENFTLQADQIHLTNIVYNLLDNALKYSSENPKVEILLKRTLQNTIFSIQDNGIGIPKAYQNKVFEKFFRVPQNNQHNTKGHGLGLTYVAEVVRLHDGEIKIINSSKQGTCIQITI